MNEKAKEWWEATAEYFQDEAGIPVGIHYGTGSPNESNLNLINQNLRGKKVLELGCGASQGGIGFAKKGAKVTGVDISEEQLEFAENFCEEHDVEIELHQGDITNLEMIEDDSFDFVYSAYAFQWIEDLQKVFSEANRALKEGGTFLFGIPHPMFHFLDNQDLGDYFTLEDHYLDSGVTEVEKMEEDGKEVEMVIYRRTFQELINGLIKEGFTIKQVVEPDPREIEDLEQEGGQWVSQNLLSKMPATIIFKAEKA
jgi:Methylase involved in ubiquinone/menaquinone biosynthesis